MPDGCATVALRFFVPILLFLLAACPAAGQETGRSLLQAGLYAEEVRGDVREAVRLFNRIIAEFPDDRTSASRAQLHIGICFEKSGLEPAAAAYRSVLEKYADQREAAAEARRRLSRLRDSESALPHVRHYYDRLGVDILTSTSYDGKWIAYTDWSTGSIVVRNLRNGRVRRIVASDWSRGQEFAFHPVWSRDGKEIAFGWYRDHRCSEVRVVSVSDTHQTLVFRETGTLASPQDWSPDGTTILCQMRKPSSPAQTRLSLVEHSTGRARDLLELSPHSRSTTFSPDGKYLAYDGLVGTDRQILVMRMQDLSVTQISSGQLGGRGIDAPVWSRDGRMLLYRSSRLGAFDLWGVPVLEGKPSGKAFLVCNDLTNALLTLKGIRHNGPARPIPEQFVAVRSSSAGARPAAFSEEFSAGRLDTAWSVRAWTQPNVYSYASLGRYSLTDNRGSLRYWLAPITGRGFPQSYRAHFSGWYWVYPALELTRPLAGTRWVLEAKATYSMVDCLNGRNFYFVVQFNPGRDRESALIVARGKDVQLGDNTHKVFLVDYGATIAANDSCISPADTIGGGPFTYTYRITRVGLHVDVEISDEGGPFREVLSCTLPSDLTDAPQALSVTGESWFLPAGSYVDWDHIRFTPLGSE
jgi:hypothetical protein